MFWGIGIIELLVVAIVGVGGTILWIWTLIHVVTEERDSTARVLWVIVIVFTHVVGALVYWIVRALKR